MAKKIKKKVAKKSSSKKKKVLKKAAKKLKPTKAPKKKILKKTKPAKKSGLKSAMQKIEAKAAELVEKIKDAATDLIQGEHKHPLLGTQSPDISLQNQKKETLSLKDIIQNEAKVVLYFYPKDDTPGCTKEACDFRDSLNRVQALGAKVIGVSPDSPEKHVKFITKYSLNFDLLSDVDHKLCEHMGVWREKSFMGKKYMGVERSTFLFKNGSIAKVWQPVKVEGHAEDVIQSLA